MLAAGMQMISVDGSAFGAGALAGMAKQVGSAGNVETGEIRQGEQERGSGQRGVISTSGEREHRASISHMQPGCPRFNAPFPGTSNRGRYLKAVEAPSSVIPDIHTRLCCTVTMFSSRWPQESVQDGRLLHAC